MSKEIESGLCHVLEGKKVEAKIVVIYTMIQAGCLGKKSVEVESAYFATYDNARFAGDRREQRQKENRLSIQMMVKKRLAIPFENDSFLLLANESTHTRPQPGVPIIRLTDNTTEREQWEKQQQTQATF